MIEISHKFSGYSAPSTHFLPAGFTAFSDPFMILGLGRGSVKRIETTRDVLIVAFVGALVASVASAILIYLTLPPERAYEGAVRAMICAAVVSFPMVATMAHQIRKIRQLSRKLQYHIDFDRLTDVATRENFFERIKLTENFPGAVLMVDIDRFKSINDTHGHLAGDAVIRTVAQCIDNNTRSSDIVARFGGEEFVVFIGGVDAALGKQVADRVRRTVERANVALADGEVVSPTVSIGVATIANPQSIDAAIRDADRALYRAKNNGRNVTRSADDIDPSEAEALQAAKSVTSRRGNDRAIHV